MSKATRVNIPQEVAFCNLAVVKMEKYGVLSGTNSRYWSTPSIARRGRLTI